jgi:TP901 family phage tail tape measure protein
MTTRTVSVKLQAEVSSYMAKFSAAGKATTDFAHKVDEAKGRSSAGFTSIGRAALVGGGLVAAGFAEAAHEVAGFESRMALVRTLSGATATEMAHLSHAAMTAGQAFGFNADQVADAQAELIKAGVSVKDILGGALTGALALAAAGQTDVAEATQTAAVAMTQFKLSGKDVPHIADLLAAGADRALGSVSDLSFGLASGGLVAAQFGLSIDDTIATLSEFAQAGLIGERGGTVLRQMFLQLTGPSQQASDLMDQLGLHTYDASGKFVGMANLAGQLHDKLGSATAATRDHALAVIFGAHAIQGANVLVADGAAGWDAWRKRVDVAGFAALQAAGKMDSLSGDATKLRSALQNAFIGAGEGANGPLRELVQDATGVVNAWNGLPGPVKAGAEALTLAGGAAALAGGAALLAIPKWAAMNAALAETRVGAISATGALKMVGKATAVGAVLFGVYEGAQALGHLLQDNSTPSVNKFTDALVDLGNAGRSTNSDLLAYVASVAKMGDNFGGVRDNMLKPLDEALSALVTHGHLDTAKTDFAQISTVLHRAGMSTDQITKLFPAFGRALSDSATSAKEAGNGVDQYGNAVSDAAQQTEKATQAAKDYNDTLHAMADPVFGLAKALKDVKDAQDKANDASAGAKSKDALDAHKRLVEAERDYQRVTHEKKPNADAVASALGRVRDAQKAYTDAVKAHLPGSATAKQANLDLAQSALDVTDAATTLAGSIRAGTTSVAGMRSQLHTWVQQGVLTQAQADSVAASVAGIIRQGRALDGLHPKLTVTADTSDAESKLEVLSRTVSTLPGGGVAFHTLTTGGASTTRASLGDVAPRYQTSARPHVVVVEKATTYQTTNHTTLPGAKFEDAKAFDEFQRRQRRRRAVL